MYVCIIEELDSKHNFFGLAQMYLQRSREANIKRFTHKTGLLPTVYKVSLIIIECFLIVALCYARRSLINICIDMERLHEIN